MIMSFNNSDWDRPYVTYPYVAQGQDVFLDPGEISNLPVHALQVHSEIQNHIDPSLDGLDCCIPHTHLSARFPNVSIIHFRKHLGMRTFAMGYHARLGVYSPIGALGENEDILKCIGTYMV